MITVSHPEIIILRTNTTNIHTLIITDGTDTRPVHPFLMPIVLWDLMALVVLVSGTHQQNQQRSTTNNVGQLPRRNDDVRPDGYHCHH